MWENADELAVVLAHEMAHTYREYMDSIHQKHLHSQEAKTK